MVEYIKFILCFVGLGAGFVVFVLYMKNGQYTGKSAQKPRKTVYHSAVSATLQAKKKKEAEENG